MKRLWILVMFALVHPVLPLAGQSTKNVDSHDPANVSREETAAIRVPLDMDLLSINGREMGTSFDLFRRNKREIQLEPGEHVVVVRYSDLWDINDDNYEKLRSKKVTLNFNADAGKTYIIVHPELSSIRDARKFEKNPDIWIEQQDIPARVSRTVEGKNAAEKRAEPVPAIKSGSGETDPGNSASDASLKKDWDSMTDKEKAAFRKWLEKK